MSNEVKEYIYLHQPVFILSRWHVEGSEHGDRCIVETRFGEDIEVWFDELQEKELINEKCGT